MNKFLNYLPVIFSALLTLGVVTVFRACAAGEDGMWMSCHHAQTNVFYTGIVITALSAAALFIKNSKLKLTVQIIAIIAAAAAMLIPGVIVRLCMMDTMRCHILMRPFVILISLLYIVSVIINIVISCRAGKNGKETTA